MAAPPKYVHIINPGTCERRLIWNKVFADVTKLKISKGDQPELFKWALNLISVFVRVRQREITQSEEEKIMG